MKLYILLFILIAKIAIAGCEDPTLITSNGIKSPSLSRTIFSPTAKSDTSRFEIAIYAYSPCQYVIQDVKIFFNGKIIYDNPMRSRSHKASFPELPGNYFVQCAGNNHGQWNFTILPPLKVEDITSATTNIPAAEHLNPELLIYPMPCRDVLTISNETEKIKNVFFYTVAGELHSEFKTNSIFITIPLDTFPAGLYIVRVATLSDKIVIKKILVL